MTYTKEQLTDKWFEELDEEVRSAYSEIVYDKLPALVYIERQHDLYGLLIEISTAKITREIYPIFLWLKDEGDLPDYVDETIANVLSLVWNNPFLDSDEDHNIDWDGWAQETKLGFLMRAVEFNEKPD